MTGSWNFGTGPWNLCQATLSESDVPGRVRVYFWHISRFTVDSTWGISVQGDSGSTVTNLKTHVFAPTNVVGDFVDIGDCLADAHLFGTLNPQTPAQTYDISSETTIWSVTIGPGSQNAGPFKIVAAVLEFDVQVGAEFKIRSFVTINGNSGSFSTPLANSQNNFKENVITIDFGTHVRGYWRHSGISMSLSGPLDCTLLQAPPNFKEWQICDDIGPEASYFSVANSKSLQTNGVEKPNKGAYGVNLKYVGTYQNHSGTTAGRVYVGIRIRNLNPGKHYGVFKIRTTSPTPIVSGTARRLSAIPKSYDLTLPESDLRGYSFTDEYPATAPVGYIGVGANGSGTVEISMANGGGAATPANLMLSREMLWMAPVDGGN